MASNVREDFEDIERQKAYVRRLVYDVLVYTLPRCGFPEADLPSPNSRENVYNRPNFVELAGLSALRVSLVLRDQWRRSFLFKHKTSGFTRDNIQLFLKKVVLSVPLSWTDTTQSVVESFLAVCNEIILFFYHEGINIDLDVVLDCVSGYITGFVSPYPSIPKKIEELVGKIYDIEGYTQWITYFIENFAIPYGSIEVSYYFYSYVAQQWRDFLQMPDIPESIAITDVRDYLGFLPDDLFREIVNDNSNEDLESVQGECSSGGSKSTKPPKSPQSSESDAVRSKESQGSRSTQSTNIPGEITQEGECSKMSSEVKIEDEFGKMSLGTEEVSQAKHGAIPKRKKPQKKN